MNITIENKFRVFEMPVQGGGGGLNSSYYKGSASTRTGAMCSKKDKQ
jgi:hypothetical protein